MALLPMRDQVTSGIDALLVDNEAPAVTVTGPCTVAPGARQVVPLRTVSGPACRPEMTWSQVCAVTVNVTGPETDAQVTVGDWGAAASLVGERLTIDGATSRWLIAETKPSSQLEHVTDTDHTYWISGPTGTWDVGKARILKSSNDAEAIGEITSPMPGTVVAVLNAGGDAVEAGAPVLVVEAMKMEHTLTAPRAGDLTVNVGVGDKVTSGQTLAVVMENSEGTPA